MTAHLLLRLASLMSAMSLVSCSTLRNAGTGATSDVSLSIISAIAAPQSGWQPHPSWPNSTFGPLVMSDHSANVLIIEIGNQSRAGSPNPSCFFTSCARCASV